MKIDNEFKDFRFNYYNIENPQRKNFSKHMHYECEILLFEEGEVSYVIEDKRYLLQPYDLLVIPSARYHFANILSSNKYSRYMIDFSAELGGEELVGEVCSDVRYFHLDKASPIVHAFRVLRDISVSREEKYNELACKTLLTEILLHLQRLRKDEAPSDNVTSVSDCSHIVDYINQNLTAITGLDELANHFFTSKSTLSHQFKESMGISLMKYVKNKRLLLAQELLRSGKKPTEIYTLCGYKDYATFFRAYVAYFGRSPRDK